MAGTRAQVEQYKAEQESQLKSLIGQLDNVDPTSERASNIDTGIRRRKAAIEMCDQELKIHDALDGGRAGTESGSEPGATDGGTLYGHSPVEQAKRLLDHVVKSRKLPDHAAEKAHGLLDLPDAGDRTLAARWVTATGDPEYSKAFGKLLADPSRGHLLWTAREQEAYRTAKAVQGELKAMTLSGNSELLPLNLDPAIMLTSDGSTNPLRQISRVVQTISNTWQGITSAGVNAEWKTEGAEATELTPPTDPAPIPVYFGDAWVPYSYEVGMDSAGNFATELAVLLNDAADQLMATAYTTGTGTGQPTGIITALPVGSIVATGTADTFVKGDVYKLQEALPARFQANARWCAALPIINLMSQMETTAGARLFPEISDGRLLNRPLHELSNMDGVINAAQSNKILLYGDFRNFVIADRIGTGIELIQNVVGTNGRPTGQRGAMLWFRTGSDSVVDNAFRVLDA
ncbi:phage major capsid protein [Kribbella shirazensis]|uniref:HK97 family phage major capsid protein n=1 Tax=Kribbella shirazensis TaxID=1105143 RepID=A0A7X6A150_9ACTN|nr:phage major capsid protein [Kribbella shirazensis]NIK57902.1 HK97 family phage major capsid protein [Kribbella shirazensis]